MILRVVFNVCLHAYIVRASTCVWIVWRAIIWIIVVMPVIRVILLVGSVLIVRLLAAYHVLMAISLMPALTCV